MGAPTTLDFGRALCAHFGLPAKQVSADVKMNTGANDVFSATVTIMLTADDLTGIAMQMRTGANRIGPAVDSMVLPPDLAEKIRKLIAQENVVLVDKMQRAGRI